MSSTASTSSSAAVSSPTSSSVSSSATPVAKLHSARALAAAPANGLADIVELIVRPMLTTGSLNEEIQALLCSREDNWYGSTLAEDPSLSHYADFILGELNWMSSDKYRYECGVNWQNTTADERYVATTRRPHDEAVRIEFNRFTAWIKSYMLVTIAEAKLLPELDQYNIGDAERDYSRLPRHNNAPPYYFLDLLERISVGKEHEDEVYTAFRVRSSTTPVSLLVLVEMNRLCIQHRLVSSITETRDEVLEEARKRASARALAEAAEAEATYMDEWGEKEDDQGEDEEAEEEKKNDETRAKRRRTK